MFDRVLNTFQDTRKHGLAKMCISKFKMMPRRNREWKYNLREVEDPIKYL